MLLFFEIVISLLAAFGLVCLGWLAFGHMVLPVGGADTVACAVVAAKGRGDGLEQTVSGLLWLRRTGLWRGRILIRDDGLDEDGARLAQRLAGYPGVDIQSTDGNDR